MKKIFALILAVLAFQSCDDGDITLQSFDFSDEEVQKCTDNDLMFKINGNELLLIKFADATTFNTLFASTPTNGTPRVLTLSSSNIIYYRKYSDNVSSSSICSDLPPATPVVTNEWTSNGGTLQIETNEVYDSNNVLTGYTHNITFHNVNFSGANDFFSFESYIFGDYYIAE